MLRDAGLKLITAFWVHKTSCIVKLPTVGIYTLYVAASGASPTSVTLTYIDYPNQRTVEPYFPTNDTSKTTLAFSWDSISQDYAYYLAIQSNNQTVFAEWVYSSTFTVNLPPGTYTWNVTPIELVNGVPVYGAPCPRVFFNVLQAEPGLEDLLGANPLEPADPRRACIDLPEDAIQLPDGRMVVSDTYHSVLKVKLGGTVAVLAGTGIAGFNGDGAALATQLFRPTGLALDPDGNIVFCDTGNFLIRKLDLTTNTITTLYGIPGRLATSDAYGHISNAALGYLKFIAYRGGTLYASMTTIGPILQRVGNLYSFDATGAHVDPLTSPLFLSQILGFDWFGDNLYLLYTDIASKTFVVKVAPNDDVTLESNAIFGSIGLAAVGDDDVVVGERTNVDEIRSGQLVNFVSGFVNVVRVVEKGAGSFLVVDSDGGSVSTVNLTTKAQQVEMDNGSLSFAAPVSIVRQDATHLLVLYNNPSHVFRFDTVTGETTLLAGNGVVNHFAISGLNAKCSPIRYPDALAVDSAGNMYIAEQNGIDEIDATTGVITVFAGAPSYAGFVDNVSNLAARFSSINGLSFDSNDNLIVSDTGNNRIRLISNGQVTTIAGNGAATHAVYGQDARTVKINAPKGAIAYRGGVLIPQAYQNSISYVNAAGVLQRDAGVDIEGTAQGEGRFLDGPRLNCYFNTPVAIAPLPSVWDFLVCDQFNKRIRRLNSVVSTVVGDGELGYGPNSLNLPVSIATLGNYMYIADVGNGVVRTAPIPH